MSSLERLPSDETDDGNIRLNPQETEATKSVNTGNNYSIVLRNAEMCQIKIRNSNV